MLRVSARRVLVSKRSSGVVAHQATEMSKDPTQRTDRRMAWDNYPCEWPDSQLDASG